MSPPQPHSFVSLPLQSFMATPRSFAPNNLGYLDEPFDSVDSPEGSFRKQLADQNNTPDQLKLVEKRVFDARMMNGVASKLNDGIPGRVTQEEKDLVLSKTKNVNMDQKTNHIVTKQALDDKPGSSRELNFRVGQS